MQVADRLRNSRLLRRPLLAASRTLFSLLRGGPPLLRRAAYDAMPVPYLVAGHPEHFVVSTADKVIGREVFLHGEFDFAKLQTALAILGREGRPAPTHLIDVGANIGTITIPALKRGLIQTATAIEPHPHNLRLLRANIALNGLEDRVTVLAQAVGDRSGVTLHLHESATNSGNHSIGAEGIPVSSSKLDDLDLPSAPSLLWMDIEGYEGHALTGAGRLLSTGTPAVCEFNPTYLEHSGGLELLKKATLGYEIFDLKSPNSTSTSLDKVNNKYRTINEFTDILLIKPR
ncbi:FkbM family methyltransferase [Thermomonas sp. XSG]|uniref:FkbM family methyltransferase n=1 Tax=Thermomonas sp. XSG TaxID=2771436 RepID=UPI001680D1C7|nr:FkbM family methyltransferase [Thermomonas sp. XSG]QNU14762.1 FkbM family methyltransferase [Thermomonas sp. XSG]